ncbi:MAG: glycogen debranching protein GlgX [Rubrimonas sp.]
MSMTAVQPEPGRRTPMGVTVAEGGVNVAVFSAHADAIEFCLFAPDGTETARVPLPERTGAIWHGFIPGVRPGDHYGLRAHGPWAPDLGHRFNADKLLLDPYARALSGPFYPTHASLPGYDPRGHETTPSRVDSAAAMPKCVVCEPWAPVPDAERPRTPWSETVIYEAHVRGLTMQHPDVPRRLRGTYEALAAPVIIEHLKSLGVTAIELLPIHAFMDDGRLVLAGLRNYWGYNSAAFFAPEIRYYGPNGRAGLRETIRRLHAEGIEVILDVVYNHTAEGDHRGPHLSFRGLDNASYYRLQQGRARRYVNDTGCGNTLRAEHPAVIRLILDSLRYWVQFYGVDGFRFDLATAIAREPHGFDREGGLLDAIRQDPTLADVKLIAEPWDIGPGGYQLGGFPEPFAEWNDRFRDDVRKFWKGEAHAAQALGDRLLGSAGVFDGSGRRAWSSVNFVACHDGFTLADATAYDHKHNEANGEGNRDGHGANWSDNCGHEGPTEDPAVNARRAARRRAMLATVFLSQGAPMLLAGDEMGNSQNGNNNAYCQDNPIGWVDWEGADRELLAFTRRLIAFRAAHPVLRQRYFLHGEPRPADGLPDVEWLSFEGGEAQWSDPGLARFCLMLRGCAEAPAYRDTDDCALIAFNGSAEQASLTLPSAPRARRWVRALDTAAPEAEAAAADAATVVAPVSVAVFILSDE